MATQYMVLNLPTVGTTPGPDYAIQLNTAFEAVDAHDHTTGKGTQVPTAGINVNAELEFNGYGASELAYLALAVQGSAPSTVRSVYANSSGDLYYKSPTGTPVQITNGTSIAAVGSGEWTYAAVSSTPRSVTTGDAQKVLGVSTSSAKTLNLPAASNVMFFIVKDVTGSAASNNISVVPDGSDTIEGAAATWTISEGYAAYGFISDGTSNWCVV